MLLLMLIGLTGNLNASAQTPEPSGQWKFDNPSDLMAAAKGNLQLIPAVINNPGITNDVTAADAGIVAAEGTAAGDGAIFVPATAALKVQRADGASASMFFSFMIDMKVPNAYAYDGIFQTNLSNTNDGEFFISKHQIGAGALGGYFGSIRGDFWYRIVFTMSNGSAKIYVNGEKVLEKATTETRFEIDPSFYLLCDEDGEKSDTYVSEVAFWETPLTDEQVAEMGSACPNPWITNVSEINEGDQFYIISDRIKYAGSKTGKPKAMSTAQASYAVNWGSQYVYWGDFDMQADGFVWTAEKVGDQWAFLNKENGKYIGNMNTGENDVIFSDTPVGYTLTDLAEGEGNFYMTNEESEHSLHVQGYKRDDRGNNSLAKQEVGDDDYSDDVATAGYPGRWRFVKIGGDEPVETGTKIETEADFIAFAEAVNGGQTDLEAYLAADIELTGNTMVGTDANKYVGIFDGKGHSITYNYTVSDNYGGLFSYTDGATIKNLRVEGTATVTAIHFGALLGRVSGTNLIENVITNVNITGQRSGVTGDGGMCGRNDGIITYNYCATLGKMGYEGSSMYSPFNGFSAGTTTLNNCYTLSELTDGTGTGNCFTMSYQGGTNTYNNSYYLTLVGTYKGGIQTTAEKVASGELCYLLNGDQSTIGWYQTLGVDAYPVPFPTSEQVYANGELRCDGTSAGGALTYSNSATSTVPPHTYESGWCAVCGGWDANYQLPVDGDGFRLIANANELAWFAEYLAKGNASFDVKLTADIDLTTSNFPGTMIASEANRFSGIFDGQGHTITYNYTVSTTHQGLFRSVKDATIRNLYVQGEAISTSIHFGALIGQAYGTVFVENVVTNVNITGQMNQVTGIGGMLGANYAQITFSDCATLGKMGYAGSSMYSSFSGWSNGDSHTTLNNCYTMCKLTEGTGTGNCFTLTHTGGPVTINNSYYLYTVGTLQGTAVTADQIASGELCYKLNGDQSVIAWYQTLGTDATPVPFSTHAQVYATGAVRCDGEPLPDSPIVYTNTEGSIELPPHQYDEDGICTVCGSPRQNADGFYIISDAERFNWFAGKVANGTPGLKAILAADINLAESAYPDLMVGTEANPFLGVFDGAGHTITYSYTVADKWRGLFAFVKDAIIRNLYVVGDAYVTNIHFGALIGHADGDVLVENVITNVDITGAMNQVTGDGGMLGANYANITFNNCATLGTLGYPGSSMYSSFSAWSNGSSSTTLNNCYSLCELTEGTGTGNCFTMTHRSGTVVINNSYYLNLIGTYVGGTQITADQVANGELCAMLGNGWYQNIGEDAYPVFDKTHNVVKQITEAGYATMYIPDAVAVPEGVGVFTGEFEEDYLKLNAVEGTVPAWEPVVLKGGAGIYSFTHAAGEEMTAEIVFADLGFENAQDLGMFTVGGLTFSFDLGTNGNGNTPKYYTSGAAARVYAGNTMTISATDAITNIEFTFGGNNYAPKSGQYEFSEGSYAMATKTWTGEAKSLTATNTGTGQWRIVSMVITYTGTPANIAGNVLKGAAEDTEATGKYILAKPEGAEVGFYQATSGTIKAGKAYLESSSGVKAFYFDEDDATGIENLNDLKDSKDLNGAIYNLAGQRISKMQKGINIVNGKKVLY